MFLLDTNIVSLFDASRRREASEFLEWGRRNHRALYFSVVTLMEMESGILNLRRQGKDRRADELAAMAGGLLQEFGDRVLPVTASVALAVARMESHVIPLVIDLPDLIVAATAQVHGLTVLTRNVRHFRPTGVAFIDPLAELPPRVAP